MANADREYMVKGLLAEVSSKLTRSESYGAELSSNLVAILFRDECRNDYIV